MRSSPPRDTFKLTTVIHPLKECCMIHINEKELNVGAVLLSVQNYTHQEKDDREFYNNPKQRTQPTT